MRKSLSGMKNLGLGLVALAVVGLSAAPASATCPTPRCIGDNINMPDVRAGIAGLSTSATEGGIGTMKPNKHAPNVKHFDATAKNCEYGKVDLSERLNLISIKTGSHTDLDITNAKVGGAAGAGYMMIGVAGNIHVFNILDNLGS